MKQFTMIIVKTKVSWRLTISFRFHELYIKSTNRLPTGRFSSIANVACSWKSSISGQLFQCIGLRVKPKYQGVFRTLPIVGVSLIELSLWSVQPNLWHSSNGKYVMLMLVVICALGKQKNEPTSFVYFTTQTLSRLYRL